MSITPQELIKIISALKKEFGNDVDVIIENIFKSNISWTENKSINFFDNSEKSVFNLNHVEIFSEKTTLPIGISSVKLSKDQKNLIFTNAINEKILVSYNNDIFVKIKKCPIGEFLKHV